MTDAARDVDGPAPLIDRELANAGPGPDPLVLADLAADREFVVLLLQRDHYCTECRKQVRAVADRYDEFRDRGAAAVSVLPESRERAAEWVDEYDLPYPVVADPGADIGDAYDQPVRFGVLGRLSDFFGRMPEAILLDCRGGDPTVAWVDRGSSTFDRPDVDDLLAATDDAATDD